MFRDLPFPERAFSSQLVDPTEHVGQALAMMWRGLDDTAQWSVYSNVLLPTARAWNDITVWQAVTARVAGDDGIPRVSDKMWEICGRLSHELWDEWVSTLEMFVDLRSFGAGNKLRINGGLSELPKAIQRKLLKGTTQVLLKTKATHVTVSTASERQHPVLVRWRTADKHEVETGFHRVVCALPASATLALKFTPPLSLGQRQGLGNLPLQSAAKALIPC
jgi:hypothetical protein